MLRIVPILSPRPFRAQSSGAGFVERTLTSTKDIAIPELAKNQRRKVFFYMHDLVHIRVHTLIFVENSELAAMSLDTIKSRLRLMVTIPAMVQTPQGAFGGPRSDSLDRLSGRLQLDCP